MKPEIKKQQKIFHAFVCELLENKNEELGKYQSMIGMVYTLVEDEKWHRLNALLQVHFPEYYSYE